MKILEDLSILTVSYPHLSASSTHTKEGTQLKEKKRKKKKNKTLRLEQRSSSCQNTGGNQSIFSNKVKSLRSEGLPRWHQW